MYRIITTSKGDLTVFRGNRATGAFGSARALHRTPRLYERLESAIKRAVKMPGQHDIMDDERNIVAIVSNGQVLGGPQLKEAFSTNDFDKIMALLTLNRDEELMESLSKVA